MIQPTTSIKGSGLKAFEATNISILQNNIEEALKQGFLSTFMFDAGSDGEEMAETFAKVIAPTMTKSISDYVQNMIKSQLIVATPVGLVVPSPIPTTVTGAMSTATDIIIN